jgi:tRNA threonylcarbamoyladenosine dehydratase
MSRPMHPFHRTELLVGGAGFDRLASARFCVIGLGGVGGHAAEALARSGVGHLTLVDFDKVCITNLNRQVHATRKTVGKRKAALMAERCALIHPKGEYRPMEVFFEEETEHDILDQPYDYVLDCIDNMTAKLHLIQAAVKRKQPILSAMGAGGRLDPLRVQVSDISATHTDPFARIVREQLRSRHGIRHGVKVVWTDEPPNELDQVAQDNFRCICPNQDENTKHSCDRRLQVQGSVSWMPAIFGMTMAGAVVNALLGRPIGRPQPYHRQGAFTAALPAERKRELLAQAGFGRPTASGHVDGNDAG